MKHLRTYENLDIENEIRDKIMYFIDYIDGMLVKYYTDEGDKDYFYTIDEPLVKSTSIKICKFFNNLYGSNIEEDDIYNILMQEIDIKQEDGSLSSPSIRIMIDDIYDHLYFEIDDLIENYKIYKETRKFNL